MIRRKNYAYVKITILERENKYFVVDKMNVKLLKVLMLLPQLRSNMHHKQIIEENVK